MYATSRLADLTLFRKAFADICRGYSVIEITKRLDDEIHNNGIVIDKKHKLLYIKHLSHIDHLTFDEEEERVYNEAIDRGLPTEENRLDYLKKNGIWTDDKERDVESRKMEIIGLENGRRNMLIPSMIETQDKIIKEKKNELDKLILERFELIGMTAEIFAQRQIHDTYIIKNIFIDPELKTQLFSEDSFDAVSDCALNEIISMYEEATSPCKDYNIRKLAVQDFFQQYYSLCGDDLCEFFGRPVCYLTYYQVRLGNQARYFHNVLSNNDLSGLEISKRSDPDAIEKYIVAKKNSDEALSKGMAPVGMTKEDIKALGLQGKISKLPNDKEMNMMEMIQHLQKQGNNTL